MTESKSNLTTIWYDGLAITWCWLSLKRVVKLTC